MYNARHGCNQQPHIFQILGILTFMWNVALGSSTLYRDESLIYQIITGSALSLVSTVLAIQYILVSLSDPTDDLIIQNKLGIIGQRLLNLQGVEQQAAEYFCDICESDVKPKSKHCRSCQRCTQEFDHHCRWVNNCIGGKNYPQFFSLVCWAVGFQVVNTVIFLRAIITTSGVILALCVCTFGLDFLSLVTLTYLLLLHVWLKNQGLTTYRWIMLKRATVHHNSSVMPDSSKHKPQLSRVTALTGSPPEGIKVIDDSKQNDDSPERQQSPFLQRKRHPSTLTPQMTSNQQISVRDIHHQETDQHYHVQQSQNHINPNWSFHLDRPESEHESRSQNSRIQ